MSHVLRTGVVDQIALFRAYNDDGTAKTDLTSATDGLSLSVFRVGLASVSIASLSNKSADDTAHADGAIRSIGGNLYSIDLPDAATATYCPSISVRGTYTGGEIEPIVHPMAGYNPSLVAVGANTAAPLDATQTRTEAAAAITAADLPTADEISLKLALDIDNGDNFWDGAVNTLGNEIGSVVWGVETRTLTTADWETEQDAATRQTAVLAAIDGIEGGTVNVLPAVGIVADRSPGATITPVVGETISQSITLYATDGTTPINLSGKTLAIVFETLQGVDVAIVPDESIAVSGDNSNVVTFAYPSLVTSAERTLRFALRDAAAPLTLYLQGLCIVTRAPQVD
jgi:hypothetical protein